MRSEVSPSDSIDICGVDPCTLNPKSMQDPMSAGLRSFCPGAAGGKKPRRTSKQFSEFKHLGLRIFGAPGLKLQGSVFRVDGDAT